MNRHERRANQRTLPPGKRAFPTLPRGVQELVTSAAENVRGKPWFSAYAASKDLFQMIGEALSEDVPAADFAARLAIAGFIECLDGAPTKCEDPFQTCLYRNSARKDQIEDLDSGVVIRGAKFVGNGPLTLRQLVDDWAAKAKEQFEAYGEIDPLVAGFDELGDGEIITSRSVTSQVKKYAFQEMAGRALDERGLRQRIFVSEI